MARQKMSSVLELSRYKVGETAWWIVLRNSVPVPTVEEENAWMHNHHPKVLYERGPYQQLWSSRAKLPKLQHLDFAEMVSLLTSEFSIEPFQIVEVIRSQHTAEFFYSNPDDEWMPESNLFCTDIAARRERNRILRLLKKWATRQST